jgi:hypothetical protein
MTVTKYLGIWTCQECGATGPGGATGFARHWTTDHPPLDAA